MGPEFRPCLSEPAAKALVQFTWLPVPTSSKVKKLEWIFFTSSFSLGWRTSETKTKKYPKDSHFYWWSFRHRSSWVILGDLNGFQSHHKSNHWGLPWWRSGWESACQCRGHGFEPWSGKIPHAAEQVGPWATTTEPARLEPVLRNKRGRDSERPAHRDLE